VSTVFVIVRPVELFEQLEINKTLINTNRKSDFFIRLNRQMNILSFLASNFPEQIMALEIY